MYSSKVTIAKQGLSGTNKIVYYFLFLSGLFFTVRLAFWWLDPQHIPQNFSGITHIFDLLFFTLLTYSLGYTILYEIFSWEIVGSIKTPYPKTPKPDLRVAFLTAFVPGSEPYEILEKTLTAMIENYYPHDTWLLDEGNDDIAKQICAKLGVKHFSRRGIENYNQESGKFKAKTKGGNYNAWLDQHGSNYDIVAQLDIDFIPRKDFLIKTIGYFDDPKVAFVGTPQVYGNQSASWIAKGAAKQTYAFYGPIQKGLYGKDMTLFIGANHIFRVSAHEDIEGYAGHITEDHLTGVKYYAKRWKSVYVPEALAIGEGPTTWDSYFNQQLRWAYGSLDILFREIHTHLRKGKLRIGHFLRYVLLEHFYFYGVAQIIGVILLMLYFLFGIHSATIRSNEFLSYFVPLLLVQLTFFFWMQRLYVIPEKESGFGVLGKLLTIASWPVFLMAFIGAVQGKRLTYKVTPKGEGENPSLNLNMFRPHFFIGSLTLIGLIVGLVNNRDSIIMLGFALLNTFFMYLFVTVAILEKVAEFNRKFTSGWLSKINVTFSSR